MQLLSLCMNWTILHACIFECKLLHSMDGCTTAYFSIPQCASFIYLHLKFINVFPSIHFFWIAWAISINKIWAMFAIFSAHTGVACLCRNFSFFVLLAQNGKLESISIESGVDSLEKNATWWLRSKADLTSATLFERRKINTKPILVTIYFIWLLWESFCSCFPTIWNGLASTFTV